jgi:hypothetical protein
VAAPGLRPSLTCINHRPYLRATESQAETMRQFCAFAGYPGLLAKSADLPSGSATKKRKRHYFDAIGCV